jgi:hypothetical protein
MFPTTTLTRPALLALAAAALLGCSAPSTGSSKKLIAYDPTDSCSQYTTADTCAAAGCNWYGIGAACPEGVDCPDGVCQSPDPCIAHTDRDSCAADTGNACAWTASDTLCPGSDPGCDGGYCHRADGGGDGCACVCPAYCLPGGDCPPCACDCPPDGGGSGGGGTCTCDCPACPPGETCPPCDCTCDPGGGDTCGGTCTCVCPECPAGETCPPCDCGCTDGGGAVGTGTVDPGDPSNPPTQVDPCGAFTDEATCLADPTNGCAWANLGVPCQEGQPCVSGVCYTPSTEPCDCVCPPDGMGVPCSCDCSGGGGTGCTAP